MDKTISNIDQKINGVASQVSQLASWAQETSTYLNKIRTQIIANQLANQAMFDAIFSALPESKSLSIETLRLVLEKREKSIDEDEMLDQQIQLTLKHLLLLNPPSPEERRKQFYLVKNDAKLK